MTFGLISRRVRYIGSSQYMHFGFFDTTRLCQSRKSDGKEVILVTRM